MSNPSKCISTSFTANSSILKRFQIAFGCRTHVSLEGQLMISFVKLTRKSSGNEKKNVNNSIRIDLRTVQLGVKHVFVIPCETISDC